LVVLLSVAGCMSLPRATCNDRQFADYIHTQAEKLPIAGIFEVRTAAAGGHVTLGGRVESPEALKQLVTVVASTPGLTELSFFGVEFAPAEIPDEQIAANARQTAANVIGDELASQLGYYCEDHRLFVYGKLPSLPMRERLDEAMRQLPGVGLYHITVEIVMPDPPSDDQVVAAVRRKFRRVTELPNLAFRASQIQVQSVNNVVQLSGRAPTFLGKLSAGSQAAQVEGVRYVINRIEVPNIRVMDMPHGQMPQDGQSGDGTIGAEYHHDLDHDGYWDDEPADAELRLIQRN
jgi:osmotically-inducible protein OsmY